MLTQLKIRNFRGFQDLTMDSLKAINLLAGENNTGKTSLLEAVFLLSSAGNPRLGINSNVLRGFEGGKILPEAVETFWKQLFFGLDVGQSIEIKGDHAEHGSLILEIRLEQQTNTDIPLDRAERVSATNQMGYPSLVFRYRDPSSRKLIESRISMKGREFVVHQRLYETEKPERRGVSMKGREFEEHHPSANILLPSVILLSQSRDPRGDAHRLAELKQRKQGDVVLEALQIIEPKLKSIEENSSSGESMIWGDIGLSELVPLAAMGEGMNRIARIVLTITVPKGGIVLVDEIENGLHHSILPNVWRYIDKLAQKFDTQIIATTHSYECIEAAHESLDAERFSLHRLENTPEKTNRCVTIKPNGVRSLIHHNLEVR